MLDTAKCPFCGRAVYVTPTDDSSEVGYLDQHIDKSRTCKGTYFHIQRQAEKGT